MSRPRLRPRTLNQLTDEELASRVKRYRERLADGRSVRVTTLNLRAVKAEQHRRAFG